MTLYKTIRADFEARLLQEVTAVFPGATLRRVDFGAWDMCVRFVTADGQSGHVYLEDRNVPAHLYVTGLPHPGWGNTIAEAYEDAKNHSDAAASAGGGAA